MAWQSLRFTTHADLLHPTLPICLPLAQDPARCTQGVALSPSAEFTSAATKECSADEAQSSLPSISKLIVSTPQVSGDVFAAWQLGAGEWDWLPCWVLHEKTTAWHDRWAGCLPGFLS